MADKKLLTKVKELIRKKHYSYRTEKTYKLARSPLLNRIENLLL